MAHPEYAQCVLFAAWLNGKGLKFTHIANEQPNRMRAIYEKKMGKSPGFPDYLIVVSSGKNHINDRLIAVEMKSQTGSQSSAQKVWQKVLEKTGIEYYAAHGADQACKWVGDRL